jgi:hypothetical protein
MKLSLGNALAALFPVGLLFSGGVAHADPAVVSVGHVEVIPVRTTYAPPPPYASPPYTSPPPIAQDPIAVDDPPVPARELYRAPMRLHLGPVGVTTGRGFGLGMGVAADFGRGSVGFRLSAAWLRGEPGGGGQPSPLSDGLAHYTGELTLDFAKRGPLHPVFGLGFGLARVNRGDSGGSIGIGTARLGLEYAIPIEDADVRLAFGMTGVLPGPADKEVSDVRGYGLLGGALAIGF